MKTVILHHSLTKDSGTKSFDAIRRYHIETKGWKDIGYQYVIEEVNGVYVTFKGRGENEVGAHTEGHNTGTIGICLVGNFDETKPTQGALNELYKLLNDLDERYNGITIMGHCDYSTKSCPGKLFPLQNIKDLYNYKDNCVKINLYGKMISISDYKNINDKIYVGIRQLFEKNGDKVGYKNGIVYIEVK